MNKGRGIAAAMAGVLCLGTASVFGDVTPASADYGSILILGDGISSGYGLPDGAYSYVDYLEECTGAQVTNLAEHDLTVPGLLEDVHDSANAAAIKGADLICVTIGGNDLLLPSMEYFDALKQDGEGFRAVLERLVKEGTIRTHISKLAEVLYEPHATINEQIPQIAADLRALNPDAEIVFQTVYNPFESDSAEIDAQGQRENYEDFLDLVVGHLNRINKTPIKKLENVTVADVFTAFENRGWIYATQQTDNVCPSELGHAYIAAVVMDTLGITGVKSPQFTKVLNSLSAEIAEDFPAEDRALIASYADAYVPDTGTGTQTTTTAAGGSGTTTTTTTATGDSGATTTTTATGGTTPTTPMEPGEMFGDVDNTGNITIDDATLTLQVYTNQMLHVDPGVSDAVMKAMDLDEDGAVTIDDATYILAYYTAESVTHEPMTWYEITGNPNAPGAPQ